MGRRPQFMSTIMLRFLEVARLLGGLPLNFHIAPNGHLVFSQSWLRRLNSFILTNIGFFIPVLTLILSFKRVDVTMEDLR